MNDTYVELLVKRKNSTSAMILPGVFMILGVLCLGVTLTMGLLLTIVPALVFFVLAYRFTVNSSIEYEYLYLNKQLSIDRISNKTRRKTIAEYDMTNMEILAPASSHNLDSFKQNTEMKIKDYSTGEKDAKSYGLVLRQDGKPVMLLIEMNDELLKQITLISPRKVFKD